MFRFLHAADLHLDSPLKGLERYEGAPVDEIRGAARRALENLVALAIDREVGFVLIAGDLYDSDWKDHNTGLFLVKQVAKLRDAGIAVYAISGNHDAANVMTRSLRLPRNPDGSGVMLSSKEVETVELASLGVAIHGRGFLDARIVENVVEQFPAARRGPFNIGLLHTSLETESEGEHARYAPCKVAELVAKEYDYWALGHIHQRRIHHQQPCIAFSGNIQGRHAREVGAKGCHLVTVDDRGHADVQFEPLDVLRWEMCAVDAGDADDGEEILERFAKELSRLQGRHGTLPLAVRVVVSGRCRVHERLAADSLHWINELRATALDLSGGRAWIEQVRFATSPGVSFEDRRRSDGPLGELVRYLDEVRADEKMAAALADELDELYRKLPEDVRRDADFSDWRLPGGLDGLLNDVEPLLVGRLLDQED